MIPTVTRMIRTAWTEATPYRPFSMDWNSSALATFFPGEIRKIMAPTDVMQDVKIEMKPVAKVVLSKGRMTPKRTSSRLAPDPCRILDLSVDSLKTCVGRLVGQRDLAKYQV